VATLQLHIDIAPGGSDAITTANEAVIENDGCDDQRRTEKQDEFHSPASLASL
jgi:hypothetical protein